MITFFSIPRPFEGEFDELQRQAIKSWQSAAPGCRVILYGSSHELTDSPEMMAADANVKGISDEYGLHYSGVRLNEHMTPLVNEAFELTETFADEDYEFLCEISSDIVLGADFALALEAIQDVPLPFVIGQRWDVQPGEPKAAKLHSPSGIDYFIYRKGTLGEIPPFAVGQAAYDNWLVWAAINRWGLTVIDATAAITAIHVNHAVNANTSETYHEERLENIRMAQDTGCNRWCGVTDAPYVLHRGQVREREHA